MSTEVASGLKNWLDKWDDSYMKTNPTMTPADRLHAEMAAASYIHDPAELAHFVNETSHLGDAGYKVEWDLTRKSNGLVTFFTREVNGETRLTPAARGTENWVSNNRPSADAVANLMNSTGGTHLTNQIHARSGVDLRTEQQRTINEVMQEAVDEYGIPEAYSGHSRGSAEMKIQRLKYGGGRVYGYNAGPGGDVVKQADNVRLWSTETDIVSAPDRLKLFRAGTGDSNVVRARRGYNPGSTTHEVNNFLGEIHEEDSRIKLFEQQPPDQLRAEMQSFMSYRQGGEGVDDSFTAFMEKAGITDLNRVDKDSPLIQMWQEEYNKITENYHPGYREAFPAFTSTEQTAINTAVPAREPLAPLELERPLITAHGGQVIRGVQEAGTGLTTGALSGAFVEGIDPNHKLGKQGDLVATAGTNLALDSAVAGGLTALSKGGLAGLRVAGETVAEAAAPTLVAYEVATTVGEAMDHVTARFKNRTVAGGLTGGTAGLAATSAAAGTQLGIIGARNAIRMLTAGGTATTDSVEGIELAETGEALAAEGLETAAAVESAEVVGAAEVAEATAAGAGALASGEEIAGGIALLPIPGARPVAAMIALGTLVGVGIGALFFHGQSAEQREEKRKQAQKELEDKYFEISDKYIDAQKRQPFDANQFKIAPANAVLTDGEIEFMQTHRPTYFKDVHDNFKTVWQNEVDARGAAEEKAAQEAGLSTSRYKQYVQEIRNGADPQTAYNKFLSQQAESQGFYSMDDYLDALEHPDHAEAIRVRESQWADGVRTLRQDAEAKGDYALDEEWLSNGAWTTDAGKYQSQIEIAHNLGLSLAQYNYYIDRIADSKGLKVRDYFDSAKMFRKDAYATDTALDDEVLRHEEAISEMPTGFAREAAVDRLRSDYAPNNVPVNTDARSAS